MKTTLRLTAFLCVSSIISFSCSSSQQIACPDHSDNAKLKHQTAQVYKTKRYKAPRVTRNHKIKPFKVQANHSQAVNSNKSTIIASQVEERPIQVPSRINVIEPAITTSIKSPSEYTHSDIDIKPVDYGLSTEDVNYEDEIQKYSVTAQNNVITNSNPSDNPEKAGVMEEASDVIKSPVPTVKSRKAKRKAFRNFRKNINNYIVAQPGGPAKPVTGFAVAALVLGILSLFLIPFIAGPLAIVFGAIALKRANSNPNKEGRGLAIAGLVTGIIGTVLGLLIYAALSVVII